MTAVEYRNYQDLSSSTNMHMTTTAPPWEVYNSPYPGEEETCYVASSNTTSVPVDWFSNFNTKDPCLSSFEGVYSYDWTGSSEYTCKFLIVFSVIVLVRKITTLFRTFMLMHLWLLWCFVFRMSAFIVFLKISFIISIYYFDIKVLPSSN